VSGIVAIVVGALALRRRGRPGAVALALLMAAVAVWSLSYALDVIGGDLATKLLGYRLQYADITLAPVAYWAFACRYTNRNRWISRRSLALILVEPCAIISLIWLDRTRVFVLPDIHLDASGPFLALKSGWGLGFWVHAAYSYVLLMLATGMVGVSFFRSRHLYRAQAAAILVAVLAPWVANALYLSGHSPLASLDLTAPALTISGVGLG
jgi:hypothetical protein